MKSPAKTPKEETRVKRLVCLVRGHIFLPGSVYCVRCRRERIVEPITRVRL
jgi:hypothetical protein